MSCNICNNSNYITILDKEEIPIWTGSSEITNDVFISNLKQCTNCGHVYQHIPFNLSQKLQDIYSSNHAQASTPPGDGNWGKERAKFFLNKVNYVEYNSAIEIGCADGYFLKFLEDYGYDKLIGIEPSLLENSEVGKIKFISAFANEETSLNCKVDLIFSNAVFEHIEDINGVLQFCNNHLNQNGELFFAIPNAQIELERGDPALFIHEHVHYYTENTLKYLLIKNGFEIKSLIQECSAIYVSAKLNKIDIPVIAPYLYENYSRILDEKLNQFDKIMKSNKNILIHGVNNKLNNILGWNECDYNFTLVDNDENKLNKIFFGQKVQSPKNIDLSKFDYIMIIPTCFYEAIKNDYLKLGFKGKFYNV
ncbi:class I SAM-dependent methyltransferase [Aliarcobacter cryaerophilus]|uniref:class I SAM-dependent methyltransferase n=1 Tax=Aliarcobacter cryaerophilus TaxID=28198 RepID=UPI0021B68A45|nr:class I SAM-dependent methyltransferase [Aliarcobacter cryaerophilus]MCT7519022.1 class I SAM-dependent methyltransferase [Aliarcobacter cryaerophilus]